MRPAKLYYEERDRRVVINGTRPSPLRINNLSNVIHKTKSTNSGLKQNPVAYDQNKRPNPPVIIYMHSPKIIHAQAREFMALVQKLTGPTHDHAQNKYSNDLEDHDDDSGIKTSSIVTSSHDEKYDNVGQPSSAVSPVFADIPLFTPNSTHFLFSPSPLFSYSDMLSPSPNTANISMPSPSFLELIKALPDY